MNQILTGKQKSFLRGLGHHLPARAMIGREGLTDQLRSSVEEILTAHELVKVKIQNNCELDRREAAEVLARQTGAAVAQILGKTFLLYRENLDKAADKRIRLP